MFTRRAIMKTTLAAGAAAVFAPAGLGHAAAGLSWKHFPAGENGFFRAPVLITGASEALLIDGGFTYSDGRAVAEAIKATGKTLTTIYVSQSDPDYYFGLKPIKQAFPQARVIAAPETVAAINGNVDKKIAVWGPQLKEDGPQALAASSLKCSTARRSASMVRPSRSSMRKASPTGAISRCRR